MVPAGALQPAHGRASALFGDTPPDDRHLAEDGSPRPCGGSNRTACFRARSTPKYRRASNTPSRPAANRSCPISSRSSAGRWKISTRSSATATPCKQPDRIYKSRTRNRQAAGFGPSRSPQLSPPHRPPSQMPRQSVPAIVPDRLPFQPRQTHPTNAARKYARQMRPANAPGKHIQQMHPAAPCPLQIEKVPSGTFSILPFRKHKPRAVPCRSRDKSP